MPIKQLADWKAYKTVISKHNNVNISKLDIDDYKAMKESNNMESS